MKFDTIITGGGLSGLVCGLRLQKAGKKCAIISAGQSAMHFSSGYFDLMDRTPDGENVTGLLEALEHLDGSHPYSKIGKEKMKAYLGEVKNFFGGCGVKLNGDPFRNGYRITPVGKFKRSWLTLEDFTLLPSAETGWKKVLIANIEGFLDFNTAFIADSLQEEGASCRTAEIRLPEMERLRKNPSEMRSTNIARVLEHAEVMDKAVAQLKSALEDEDAVILPAVFSLNDSSWKGRIAEALGREVFVIATMPPSVPGIRTQMRLRTEFESAGGVFLAGDTACCPDISENNVNSIGTVNFGDIRLTADDYVLASGSFFSKGLTASPDRIAETVFGLDVDAPSERKAWYDTDFFKKQEYISSGVRTDNSFHCFRNGTLIENLYAAGSVLSGSNTLYEGSGAGIAILSAFAVADSIISKGK